MTEPYRWGGIEPKSLIVPVSAEMAAAIEAGPTFADMWKAARDRPRPTLEQQVADIEHRNDEAGLRHGSLLDRHNGLLRDVIAHHAPVPIEHYYSGGPSCAGCDEPRGYAEDLVAWPCSTFLMIEDHLPAVETP